MISGIPQPHAIEDIVERFRTAWTNSVTETGYAHFEVDCFIINPGKDLVRVELTAGTKYSFTVLRRLQPPRGNMRFPGGRTRLAGIPQQQMGMENTVDLFRDALVCGVTETGYAHIEVDCSKTNEAKDIVSLKLSITTKYSATFSRKPIGAITPNRTD